MCKYCSHLRFSFIFWQEHYKLFFIRLFFVHWPKKLWNVTMAGYARCQIWGPTAGKHQEKSVIWVTVFEDMKKFTNGALTWNVSASKQILGWKSKKEPFGIYPASYNLPQRRQHWNATTHLDVAFLNNSYNGREISQYTGSTNVKSFYLFRS